MEYRFAAPFLHLRAERMYPCIPFICKLCDVGMTFRVPHFGTLGTAQYGDTEEAHIEARKAYSP